MKTKSSRIIHCPIDTELREDLRKPERLVSPSGRVSIAATTDQSGHADHFWSLALALDAANEKQIPPTQITVVKRPWRRPFFNTRRNGLSF